MTPTIKLILVAVVSFVLGHISCALIHHFHHHMHTMVR
jgi:type III secretory pathway component EscS